MWPNTVSIRKNTYTWWVLYIYVSIYRRVSYHSSLWEIYPSPHSIHRWGSHRKTSSYRVVFLVICLNVFFFPHVFPPPKKGGLFFLGFFSRFLVEGRKEGRKEGSLERRKEGRKEGRLEGRKEGRKAGRQAGRQAGRRSSQHPTWATQLCRHGEMLSRWGGTCLRRGRGRHTCITHPYMNIYIYIYI